MLTNGSTTGTAILVALALLPAIVLCIYVFNKDRVEKEPIGLLLKLLLFGALSIIPVLMVTGIMNSMIANPLFPNAIQVMNTGTGSVSYNEYYAYLLYDSFIGVALVEEGMKLLALILVTRKSKEFNSLFDGIIYAVFVSLGFAALENIMYVLSDPNGVQVAIMRAVLSVPGHMFFGVLMGYHYTLWNITEKVAITERALKAKGRIPLGAPEANAKRSIIMCILIPVLAHGFYDFCCFVGTPVFVLCLYAFVIFMYIHCFAKIKKMSRADGSDVDYVTSIIIKKYPHLVENK